MSKIELKIDKFRLRPLNFGFLGACILLFSAAYFDEFRWWIGILILITGWFLFDRLVELEVNRWLKKKARIYLK